MKGHTYLRWVQSAIVALVMTGIGVGCASDGEEEELAEEELEVDDNLNAAEVNEQLNEENNSQFAEQENLGTENFAMQGGEGENLAGGDFSNATDPLANAGGDPLANDGFVAEQGFGAQAAEEAVAGMDGGFSNDTGGGLAPAPAAAPAQGGGVVKFVATSGTPLYQDASPSSAVVENLDQGESLLVMVQGEWAQVPNRGWVQVNSLADQAVPRSRAANPWR